MILLLVCLALAFYAKLDWLVTILAVCTALAALIPSGKPAKMRSNAPAKEEDETILHPVIYEDVGGPSMYPEYQEITVKQGWPPDLQQKFGSSLGALLHVGKKGVKKVLKAVEE